jgi:hypothetical protein
LLTLAACSQSVFNGSVYRGNGFAFRIGPVGQGWERIQVSHAPLAFRDTHDGATIAVNARCHADGEDVPLASLTQHLFMQFTDREIEKQEVVPFDGREAMHTVLVAKLDGVPLKFDVWVLKKDGCVYDFAFMAPVDRFAHGVPDFSRFVQGFATISDP